MATDLPLGLVALPHGVEDIVEVAGTYHVVYRPVTIVDTQRYEHVIGPIRVEIRPPAHQYQVAELRGFLPAGQTHPHILRMSGDICLGNYRGGIMTAIQEGLWVTAIVLLGEILDSYNPRDCYHRLERPVACHFCQRPEVPEMVRCRRCRGPICTDCRHPAMLLCPHCLLPCASCLEPAERTYHTSTPVYCPACQQAVFGAPSPRLAPLLARVQVDLPLERQWGKAPSLRTKTAWKEHYRAFHGREPNDWAVGTLIPDLPKARIMAEVVAPATTLTLALREAEEGLLFEDDAIARAADLGRSPHPLLQQVRLGRYFLGRILGPPSRRLETVDVEELRATLARRLQLACLYQWKERHPQ